MTLLQDVNRNTENVANAEEKRPADDKIQDDTVTSEKKTKIDNHGAHDCFWSGLSLKELKQRCKAHGLKVSGNKSELIERLQQNDAASIVSSGDSPHRTTAPPLSSDADVQALLQDAGISNPENTSMCVRKAILQGYLSLEGDVDQTVFSGLCSCGDEVSCTLRDMLFQPDNGGHDYEEGAPAGALQCKGCNTGYYLSKMCENRMEMDSGKGHNHCAECGSCSDDYREQHCLFCDKHFFQAVPGFSCPDCHSVEESETMKGFFDPFSDTYSTGLSK